MGESPHSQLPFVELIFTEEVITRWPTSLYSQVHVTVSRLPRADAVNEAGGRAYKLEPKHALAQVAATGTFGNAFYSTATTQLDEVLKLIDEVDDNQYLAKLALYAREKAFMKDMPAALLVALSVRDTELMHRVFDRVVDNGRVLRTVFQMIRSGQFKSKSGTVRTGLSSSVQRAFQRWLNNASVGKLLSASIGNDPSLRDILRMARPTPKDNARRAMFGWLTDKTVEKWAPATEADLPAEVQSLIAYRNSESEEAQALIAGGLEGVRWDLLVRCRQGTDGLGCTGSQDGSAGAAYELEHFAATRCVGNKCDGRLRR